jgi:hypothetical protein
MLRDLGDIRDKFDLIWQPLNKTRSTVPRRPDDLSFGRSACFDWINKIMIFKVGAVGDA